MDVLPVEGSEVVIVKGRALAELAIPGLERLRRLGLAHFFVHAGADFIHFLEVCNFAAELHLFHVQIAGVAPPVHEREANAPRYVGPAVGDEIDGEVLPRQHGGEVFPALPLPTGLKAAVPVGVRLAVAAQVHGGGGALEDVQGFRVGTEEGNALNGRGAGADDAHPLIRELVQIPLVIPAGVVVVPA